MAGGGHLHGCVPHARGRQKIIYPGLGRRAGRPPARACSSPHDAGTMVRRPAPAFGAAAAGVVAAVVCLAFVSVEYGQLRALPLASGDVRDGPGRCDLVHGGGAFQRPCISPPRGPRRPRPPPGPPQHPAPSPLSPPPPPDYPPPHTRLPPPH